MNSLPITHRRTVMALNCGRLIAFTAIALAIIGFAPVFAQGFDLTGAVQPIATGAINTVRAIAVVIVIIGFAMFAAGRMHYAGAFVIIIGLIGIGRAQQIATALMSAGGGLGG